MDPMSMYGPMMMAGADPHQHMATKSNHAQVYQYPGNDIYKQYQGYHSANPSSTDGSSFTDYDDDFGNYYMRSAASKMRKVYSPLPGTDTLNPQPSYVRHPPSAHQHHNKHSLMNSFPFKRIDNELKNDNNNNADWIMPTEEQEAIDDESDKDQIIHKRVKRQAVLEPRNYHYQSGYPREPPCYGFPLEVNVRSRIKMDRLFPIYGNSQHKKCIKRFRMPTPGPNPDYVHILQKVY